MAVLETGSLHEVPVVPDLVTMGTEGSRPRPLRVVFGRTSRRRQRHSWRPPLALAALWDGVSLVPESEQVQVLSALCGFLLRLSASVR